jgi:SAM-dependent methyltransferase
VPIEVVGAVAEDLPMADDAVDAAVTSLTLCSVSDIVGALAELRRVLRPCGELRFLEHVIAERGPLRVLQRLAAPLCSRMPDGCHIDRDTLASIPRAGFAIEQCEHFMHADGALEPAISHVLGTAQKSGPAPQPGACGAAHARCAPLHFQSIAAGGACFKPRGVLHTRSPQATMGATR